MLLLLLHIKAVNNIEETHLIMANGLQCFPGETSRLNQVIETGRVCLFFNYNLYSRNVCCVIWKRETASIVFSEECTLLVPGVRI